MLSKPIGCVDEKIGEICKQALCLCYLRMSVSLFIGHQLTIFS